MNSLVRQIRIEWVLWREGFEFAKLLRGDRLELNELFRARDAY